MRKKWTWTYRGKRYVKMEDIRMMHLQVRNTKACQQLTETRRGKEGFSPEDLEGTWPCWHFDSNFASRTVRECIFVVLGHPVCGNLFWKPSETDTRNSNKTYLFQHGAISDLVGAWPGRVGVNKGLATRIQHPGASFQRDHTMIPPSALFTLCHPSHFHFPPLASNHHAIHWLMIYTIFS